MMQRILPRYSQLLVLLFALLSITSVSWTQPGLTGSSAWPQGEAGTDFNLVDAANKKEGKWIRVWPNGNLYYAGSFRSGEPMGVFTFYYESGEVMSEVIQSSNGMRASTQLFRKDGSLQAKGLYLTSRELDENDENIRKKQGEWKYFDSMAELRLVENYENDVLNGDSKRFGSKGQLLEKGEFVRGNRHGMWQTWDETRILLSEIGYDNGHFHGTCRVSHSNGRPRSIGMYKNGQEHGFWKTFAEDGTLENTRQFEEGELVKEIHENGDVLVTFPDGRPREEFSVINQQKEGPFREWHDAGEWALEEAMDPVSGDKFFRRVLDGELIRREGEYSNGLLDGEVFHYDNNNRLHLIETYENGKLIASEIK